MEEQPELTLDQLDALTAEVNVHAGPGSPGWVGETSHTQRFTAAVIDAFRTNDGIVPGELASMGGADRHPPWYYNVAANPVCTVEWQGETFTARAVIHSGVERDRLFAGVVRIMPVFGEYETRTDRVMPVVEFIRLQDA